MIIAFFLSAKEYVHAIDVTEQVRMLMASRLFFSQGMRVKPVRMCGLQTVWCYQTPRSLPCQRLTERQVCNTTLTVPVIFSSKSFIILRKFLILKWMYFDYLNAYYSLQILLGFRTRVKLNKKRRYLQRLPARNRCMQLLPLLSAESSHLENKVRYIYFLQVVYFYSAIHRIIATAFVLLFSSLAFYDCSANSFDKQFVICSLDYCVLTMDYW